MKRNVLIIVVMILLVSVCGIASAISEDEFLWTNMNNDPVRNGAPDCVTLHMAEEEPIQLERITTYHWNNGEGVKPGTVSIYSGDTLLSSWQAVGRSAYGAENVYWDADVNIVLLPGYEYTVRLSDESGWSYNAASENCGMIEFYGHRLYEFNGWISSKKGKTGMDPDQCASPDPGIEIILNNNSIVMLDERGMPTAPLVLNDTIYIPARTLSEIIGFDFHWDPAARKVFYLPPQNVSIVLNNETINQTNISSGPSVPLVINDTIYIPAPTVKQITGFDITWDPAANRIAAVPAVNIEIVVNNQTITNTTINQDPVVPVIINNHVYLPIETVSEITDLKMDWDEENNILNITGKSAVVPSETQAHGYWKLVETIPYIEEDDHDGPRTWRYGYETTDDGVRYMIDYTWSHSDEYQHYTAYGEVSDPPEVGYPGEELIMDLRCYTDPGSVEANPRPYSRLGMEYFRLYNNGNHMDTQEWTNVDYAEGYEKENKIYFEPVTGDLINYRIDDQSGELFVVFPEGKPGDSIDFGAKFNRMDRVPISTTWKYVWVD